MKAPQSRLLARLDAALAKTRHPIEAACLRAERAGFLARLGHFDEARAVLGSLHAQFDPQPSAPVSAWLCMTEGWMLHFGSLSADARDKMKRAQALSAAAGLVPLQALSSAWLAHMNYLADEVDDMLRNVALALKLAAPDHHSARARACMVMALSYDFGERLERAQPWYLRAREHANADGDETTLSALNYNISSHRAHHAVQAALFGGDAQDQARQALASAEATGNFDAWVGTASLDALVPMQRAGIASVQGQYGEALALYEKHFDAAGRQGLARLAAKHLADMAWCRWHLGDSAGARRDAQAAADRIATTPQMDDRAVAHARLAALFKLLDDDAAASRHAAQGREDWAAHRRFQAAWVDALEAAQLRP
jgi:tetratricopeptide (TPR) repeat protein